MIDFWHHAEGPVQIAYAVNDVRAAAAEWADRGVGPFFVREHIPVTNARMHGTPAPFDHSSAYGQWGDVMVELICEHHDAADRIGPDTGVHHLAFFVPDIAKAQEELVTSNCPEVLFAQAGSTDFAMHASASHGHLIEVYQPSPGLRDFYAMVRTAAADWSGNTPIRTL